MLTSDACCDNLSLFCMASSLIFSLSRILSRSCCLTCSSCCSWLSASCKDVNSSLPSLKSTKRVYAHRSFIQTNFLGKLAAWQMHCERPCIKIEKLKVIYASTVKGNAVCGRGFQVRISFDYQPFLWNSLTKDSWESPELCAETHPDLAALVHTHQLADLILASSPSALHPHRRLFHLQLQSPLSSPQSAHKMSRFVKTSEGFPPQRLRQISSSCEFEHFQVSRTI